MTDEAVTQLASRAILTSSSAARMALVEPTKLVFRDDTTTAQSVALAHQINEILAKGTFPAHDDV